MKIVLDASRCGIGDVVCAAWIAEGANRAGHEVVFLTGGYDPLVTMLGQRFEASDWSVPIATDPNSLFNAELRIRGERQPRPTLWQRWLPFDVTPARPMVKIPERDLDWARRRRSHWMKAGKAPLAVLFPSSHFNTRRWPLHKFMRVAFELRRCGWAVAGMDSSRPSVERFPFFLAGCTWGQLAAMMSVADCVVANDSGPAHMAGTIGTKTFAVMGPTNPQTVYGHCPEVEAIRAHKRQCACVGCHFEPERGFSLECDVGCEALALLGWEDVARRVDEWNRLGRAA